MTLTVEQRLEINGKQIENILKTMGIKCTLQAFASNELVEKYEFNLTFLNDYKKIKKATEIMSVCLHKEYKQAESNNYNFAIEVKKDNVVLDYVKYAEKFESGNYASVLGIDNDNQPVVFDLEKSIHTLISGATGMGKTSIINNIIYSITKKNTPKTLQLCLIDVKKTLCMWKNLPHLMCEPVDDEYDAFDTLSCIRDVLEERLVILSKHKLSKATPDMFPRLVVVVDELADLMLTEMRKYIEDELVHIAQVGRAVNISLVLATQNPLVKVCTSLIKANCPTRIALKTVSTRDSINILDNKNACLLDGVGCAIIRSADNPVERTFKSLYLSDTQIKEYTDNIKRNNK